MKAHGRVVAELVPPNSGRPTDADGMERLIASGVVTPPTENGDPLENMPEIRRARGPHPCSLIASVRKAKSASHLGAGRSSPLPASPPRLVAILYIELARWLRLYQRATPLRGSLK